MCGLLEKVNNGYIWNENVCASRCSRLWEVAVFLDLKTKYANEFHLKLTKISFYSVSVIKIKEKQLQQTVIKGGSAPGTDVSQIKISEIQLLLHSCFVGSVNS